MSLSYLSICSSAAFTPPHSRSPIVNRHNGCVVKPFSRTPALIYGPDLGYTPLRKRIVRWLTSLYSPAAGSTPIGRICITGGASPNLLNILAVFTDPSVTQHIWMVAPTYFLASTIFEDAGFAGKLRGIPEMRKNSTLSF